MRRSRIFPEVATQEFGLLFRYLGLAKSNSDRGRMSAFRGIIPQPDMTVIQITVTYRQQTDRYSVNECIGSVFMMLANSRIVLR
jgi:hypothetical protein